MMDLDALREQLANWERIGVKGPVYDAARAALDSEEAWWCETHDAEGVPLPWGWEADECWRCIYTDVDPNAGLCRVVRRRLLAEEGT